MKFFKVILFLIISQSSWANVVCPIDKELINRVIFDDKMVSKADACTFGLKVNQALLPLKTIYPGSPTVSIHLTDEFDNASYDNGTLLKLPLKFYSLDKDGVKVYKSEEDLMAIILHEYGHAVLAKYLNAHWDTFSYYHEMGLKISELEQQMLLSSHKALEEELASLKKDLMSPRDMRRLPKVITPYQELFADVVSTYLLNNKSAITDAITTSNDLIDMHLLYRARDFTGSDLDLGKLAFFPHAYFFKARHFIGSELWPKDEKEMKKNILVLLEAIVEELNMAYNNSYFMTDPQYDNDTLIETINSKYLVF